MYDLAVVPDTWWRKSGRMRPTLRSLLFVPTVVLAGITSFILAFLVLLACTGFSLPRVGGYLGTALTGEIIQSLAAVSATWFLCRVIERRSWLDLGFRLRGADLRLGLQGWGLGAGMQTLVVLLGLVSGTYALAYNWGAHGSLPLWLLYVVTMALVGFSEEALLRGYLLQTLAEAFGRWPAALITAVLFGAMHLGNPGAGWASTLGITVFGLWAAYAVFASRSMWPAIAMHMMWNVFEGVVWGLPNSGNPEPYAIFAVTAHGPDWWTGGGFGPEAGLISTLALVAGFFTLRLLWRRPAAQP